MIYTSLTRQFCHEQVIVTSHDAAEKLLELLMEHKINFADCAGDYSKQQRAVARMARAIETTFWSNEL